MRSRWTLIDRVSISLSRSRQQFWSRRLPKSCVFWRSIRCDLDREYSCPLTDKSELSAATKLYKLSKSLQQWSSTIIMKHYRTMPRILQARVFLVWFRPKGSRRIAERKKRRMRGQSSIARHLAVDFRLTKRNHRDCSCADIISRIADTRRSFYGREECWRGNRKKPIRDMTTPPSHRAFSRIGTKRGDPRQVESADARALFSWPHCLSLLQRADLAWGWLAARLDQTGAPSPASFGPCQVAPPRRPVCSRATR